VQEGKQQWRETGIKQQNIDIEFLAANVTPGTVIGNAESVTMAAGMGVTPVLSIDAN
jgi:hypothetical protein